MSKRILLLAVPFLFFWTLLTHNAHAGFLNWFNWDRDASSDLAVIHNQSWSFNKLYFSIQDFNLNKTVQKVQENSVTESNPANTQASPKSPKKTKAITVLVTGYSSTVDQTDSSPFITAAGTYVRDGIVATNLLPFGTTIKIPELFGDRIFVVEDRMNSRYLYNVDIWFPERNLAKNFGVKRAEIEITS